MTQSCFPVDPDRCRVLVLGLGASGLSIVRFALDRGIRRLRVHDSRSSPPGLDELERLVPDVDRRTGALDAAAVEDIDVVVASPGVRLDQAALETARARGIPILGDVELFARSLASDAERPWVLAVTGTNGKTTVTTLAGELARAGGLDVEVAGNIGPPVLDALLAREAAGRPPEAWVLELSSFQLELTSSLAADAATMLNLSEDHLDRHGTLAAYAQAKSRIFLGDGLQVLNRDDPASLAMRCAGRPVIDFGLDATQGAGHYAIVSRDDGGEWLMAGELPVLPLADLPIAGRHNAANALAALALVSPLGIPVVRLAEALRAFRGLPHRVECVHEAAGVRYYDDSKGTNVGATVAALDGLGDSLARTGGRIVLIAGGDGKGQRFEPLAAPIERHVRELVLIGRDGPAIGQAIGQALAGRVPQTSAVDLPQAVLRAREAAMPGDIVLLSPACASLDMFRDYAHRAQVFVQAVKEFARD